jgi:CRISPR-associated protein Cmr6
MGANIGWLFYKDYFKEIDYAKLDNPKNEMLINKKVANIISQTPTIQEAEVLGKTHFTAKTIYPGLLLGSGNTHELPDIKGQAILGFHFDYTSGLPVIQGSSIKGVLRSAFKHAEYIHELLKNETLDVKELEKEIFENSDIFFDATISNVEGKILGDDYITPHANELKDPIPLRFIKVLPNVTFRFDFELSDGLITKEQKSKLFQEILEDLGLGAKTNVGYGKFENFNPYKTDEEKVKEAKEIELKKEQEAKKREIEQEALKQEKQQKAKEGINALDECKTVAEAFVVLKNSFGKVPKTTPEQKAIIQAFIDKQKNISPSDKKVFGKYLK